SLLLSLIFFFNAPAISKIYTLSLHDALPIYGTLYNTQLVFDANGELVLKRRKITPTYHERMIWGQGDGSGLKVVPTAVGRLGARSEEHTSELQSHLNLVCRLLLEKKKKRQML